MSRSLINPWARRFGALGVNLGTRLEVNLGSMRISHILAFSWLALNLCGLAQRAQTAATPQLAFETASIRPAHMTMGCFSMVPPGSTYYALTCVTLRNLIEMAYDARYVDGDGGTLDSYYDLRATTPAGRPWTMETVRPMLQQFLAERFHLTVHAGKREVSGYGMIVAKGGAKLHPVAPESVVQGQKAGEPSQNFTMPGHVQGRGMSAAGIANLLSFPAGAPVTDHTELPGIFNVDLSYAPDNNSDSGLPFFFTALEEQLGLKLRSEKVVVDTLVVDHADHEPTPN